MCVYVAQKKHSMYAQKSRAEIIKESIEPYMLQRARVYCYRDLYDELGNREGRSLAG